MKFNNFFKKDEVFLYVLTWKDAHDIYLRGKTANCSMLCIFYLTFLKEKNIYEDR